MEKPKWNKKGRQTEEPPKAGGESESGKSMEAGRMDALQ